MPLQGIGAVEKGAVSHMLQQRPIALLMDFLHLGVLLFIVRSLKKDCRNQFIAGLPGFAGILGIAIAGLGLTGEGGEQVFFGSASFEIHSFLLEYDFLEKRQTEAGFPVIIPGLGH
jgi:hypothetical protein